MRVVSGILLAVLMGAGLAAGSQLRYGGERDTGSWLRLAWRVKGVRVEHCRARSAEELAALPAHMRQPEICDGSTLPYHLRVTVDGAPVLDREVHASGAFGDRPLFVNEAVRLEPGQHRIDVSFTRAAVHDSAARVAADATPARLRWTGSITLASRQVALVTYDAERRALVARGYGVE